jgi:HK97 family phage major capsid protein
MHTYLQRLIDERDALTQSATAKAEEAAAEGRDLTDTEQDSLRSWSERCAKIDSQLTEYNGTLESTRAYARLRNELDDKPEVAKRSNGMTVPAGQLETRSWGQQFVESEQFQTYTGHGSSARFAVPDMLDTRAAITTANLPIPHFVWAPKVYETRAPLLEVCGRVTVSSGVVDWVELGGDPQAAVVAEGAAKPEAAFTATPKSAALDTIAHWIQITRQALSDAPYIRGVIEGKLRRGLLNKAEADMAAAIDASTAVQTATATAAQGGLLGAIRVGLGKVQSAGFVPNAVALNPADYAALDLSVMSTAQQVPSVQSQFWGMSTVAAAAIPAGKAYVGDFATGATLFDRGVTDVFISDSHASLFISNILVILAEARLKSAVTDPLALCECTAIP